MSEDRQEESEGQILLVSEGFRSWLLENRCSLAFTTHARGRVALVGLRNDGQLWAQERFVDHCQGLYADSDQLLVSTPYMFWRFRNVLPPGTSFNDDGADRLYFPRQSHITGALNIREICIDGDGEPIFVNTLHSCLARPDDNKSFVPVWKPPFVTQLAPEDRCHLNGLAIRNGKPAFVTVLGRSDVANGWRDSKIDSGLIISVRDSETVAGGLSMPNSPRFHEGDLWILNAGSGEFGRIDRKAGKFDPVTFCSGYARGLAFVNDYAVIGVSRPRQGERYGDLALDAALQRKGKEARCGVIVVSLKTGEIVHWLRFTDLVREIFSVCLMPGVRQPGMVGFQDEAKLKGFIDFEDRQESTELYDKAS